MNRFWDNLDERYVKICAYAGVTAVLVVGALMLLYFASPVFAKIWELLCAVVEPLVYGAALSYVLNPLVKRVSAMLKRHEHFAMDGTRRRMTAVALSLVLVALFLLAIVAIFVLMVTHSVTNLRWESIQALFGEAQGGLMHMVSVAQKRLEEWGIISLGGDHKLLDTFNEAKNVVTTIVFAVIFGVYFLIDGPRVTEYLGRVARALLGRHAIDPTPFFEDADRVFSGYFRGQGIDALVVGLLSGIALTIVGVPFAPVVGLLAGLGNLIPYVGGPVGFCSIALMCIPDMAWGTMIAGFVVMAIVMFVDANVINPKLLSDNVEVHPILVVAALIAGGAVGGLAGMLVAVPFAAFIKIQVDRWLERRENGER